MYTFADSEVAACSQSYLTKLSWLNGAELPLFLQKRDAFGVALSFRSVLCIAYQNEQPLNDNHLLLKDTLLHTDFLRFSC